MLSEIENVPGLGVGPPVAGKPTVEVADEAGARALTGFCLRRGWNLHAWAGGEPPSRDLPPKTVLVTPGAGLTGDYAVAVDDCYCEAPATMTAAEIERRLEETPLWLPFATPGAASEAAATLVARYPPNAFAPAYGELHRFLFGLSFVSDDGDVVSTGRKTIKGVAGYDISKVFLGSWGRAGLITRVRLRLFPRPAEAAFWRAPADAATFDDLGDRVCLARADEETLIYVDGHPGDVAVVGEKVRRAAGAEAEVSRGAEAARDFAAAVASLPRRAPSGPPAGWPAFSALFI
jgi:FAD/FMN-containing dehydrogenase